MFMNRFLLRILVLLPSCLLFQEYRSQCYSAPSYCKSFSSQVTGAYNYGFTNITIGSINNTTTANTTGNNIYQDYTSLSTTSTAGSTISGSFTFNTWASVRVFVDWNNDGVFNTSGAELCFTNTNINSNTTTSFTIAVPSGQANGSYRVRIAGDYWGSTVTPCGPLVNPGEVEDYTILLPNATLDAAASNVFTPSELMTSPVSNAMSFSIQNISSTTITSVNAGYTVNGGTAVTQSFTGLSIAPGASHTLTFSTGLTAAILGNYQLRFFISSLNGGSSTPTPLNDTICKTSLLVCTGPLSGSYTINAASALSSTNFPSFTLAAAALANCGISGPVVFNVAAGTYNEAVTISAVTGSSATNTITFDGGNGNKDTRIITFPTSATSMSVVRLQNTRNITLRNLTIRSTSITQGNVLHFLNDSNDRVNNCTIEFPSGNMNSSANVVVVSGINVGTACNTCRNIVIDSNTINNGSAGVFMNVSPSTFTNHILYNTINNSNANGIYFQGQAALKIRHNTINLLISSSSKSGIFINGTTNPSSPLFHDFSNNKIYNASYSGMHLVYMMTSASNRTLISNNFIGSFNPISSQGYKGIRLNNCTFMNIFHNSINCNAIPLNTSADVSAALFSENSSANIDVRNNQLVCPAPSGNLFPVHAPSSAPFSTLNYNNYFNSASEDLLSIGGTVLNLTNYKTAVPFNGGANSASENPGFISNSDLHVINPCLIGVSGTGVTTDIDLQTRTATPTMGADEVLSIPTNDLGIQTITSPNFPLTSGSNTVTVVLKNYGSNTITSATINYKLNSGAVISQAWTGSLASCASASFSFTTPVTIAGGSNTFICYTSSPNGSADNQTLNDTARWTLCNALSGVYTLGFGGDYPTFNSAISALSCGGLGGAVTFNVLPGTYDTYINIPNIRGSSATNTILIQPSNGLDSSVIIKPTTNQNSGYIVQLNGVDYLTFHKIAVVASTSDYYRHGIRFGNNSNFITISNCIVHHTHANGIYNEGISHSNTSDMNVTITGNRIYGGQNGITCYSFNTPPIRSYNISGNTCINQVNYGIYFAYGDSTKVNNNYVSSNQTNYQYGIKFDANRVGGEMRNNRVLLTNANRTSQSYGIITYNFNYQSSGIRGLIANNMVSISGTGNYRGFSIEATTPHTDMYHNTVSMMSNHASAVGAWWDATSSTSNFRNNVFQNLGGGLAIRTSGGSGVFSHNNYFSSGTNQANNSGTNYTILSAYQTATSQHANSLNKRIRYTSASDLSTTSPCIGNAGMNLTSLVPLDINNLTRASTPDLGAVEFSTSAVEAGLLNIISPLTSATTGSTCTVTATVINNGSSPITSLDLNYVIGASNAAQSFTTSSGIPVGGILPCDTLNLSFTTTFVLASTHRRLRVFISSVNSVADASQTNDTLIAKLCTTAATTSISQSICHGASYFFKGANRTVAGIYIDTLATSVGCDSIITLTLSVLANTNYTSNPIFNSTGGGVDTIKVCSGSNVTLTGAGATTYAWSGPQTITNNTAFSAISSGLYTVTGTSGACVNTKSVFVQIFALPTLSYTSTPAFSSTGGGVDTIKVCSGTNVTIAGSGANTYIWSGPQSISDNTPFSALVSGRYTLTGTSINSCVNTRSVFVSLAHPVLVISSSAGALISGTYVSTYAGSGASGPLGSVSFNNPSNMCYDKSKNMYVVDASNRVFKITPSGTLTTYAGTGASGSADGAALSATFNNPFDIVADTADNLYIAENAGSRIRKISNTGIVSTLAGSGAWGFADGTGAAAQFQGVMGLCIDPQGNLYAADNTGNRIRKITPAGVVTTIAGSGAYTSVDGIGAAASLMRPHALCIDSNGNLYVGEGHGNKIRKITPSGVVTTLAGTGVAGSADGTVSTSTWNHPIGVKLDAEGNLIVVDFGNHKIRKITLSTGVVSTIAGTGSSGIANGTLASATFTSPWGLLIAPDGSLFIADRSNSRLRKINLGADTAIVCAGTSVTLTSTGAASYSWTGPQAVTNGVPFTVSTQGQYSVSGTGSNGCISEKNVYVKLFAVGYSSTPAFSSTGGGVDTIKVCLGNSVTLTGSGAASYAWSGPQTISNGTPFTVTTSGNYTVSGTSASGCISTKVVHVLSSAVSYSSTPASVSTGAGVDTIKVCTGGNATLAGSGAVSYAWSGPQAITNNVSFGVTASGRYTVTGTASSGCTSTKQVFVLLNTLPSVSYTSTPAFSSTGGGVDTIVGINGNSLLLSGSGANTYSWSGPQSITNGVSFVASSSGEYTVTGTGAGGCTNTKKVYVKLITIALNLASSSNNGVKFVRKANVGSFIYYGDASNYYFAIDTSGITSGSLTGDTVSISVQATIDSFKSSSGVNQEHAMFLLPRYWDAKGSFTGTVMVRFPYLPADTATLTTLRDSAWARLKRTNTNTLAVKTSKIEWFKTVGVPYTAAYISGIVGNKFPSTIVKPSVTYGVTGGGVHYVELSGITSFSGGGAGVGFGPGGGGGGVGLPVTWAGFDVKTLESGNELIWKTASEKNTDYFEVEYSYDAKEFKVGSDWIQAAGNSASLNTYSFHHSDFNSFVYYRIKQVDLDGQFDYSAIKLAKRAKGKEFIVSVYPTQIPDNGRITVDAKNIDKSQISLSIMDVSGKFVYTNSYIPNTNSLREVIDLINLQPGVYFIEISNGQGREVVKVVR